MTHVPELALTRSHWPATEAHLVAEVTVGALLRRAAALQPNTLALVEGVPEAADRRQWTYAELLAEAEVTAAALLSWFAPGERVAVWANNRPEWIILQLGAALAGLTLVTANPALRPAEVRHVLSQSRSAGVFLCEEYRGNRMAATLAQIRPDLPYLREVVPFGRGWDAFRNQPAPSDVAFPEVSPDTAVQIQYTSGTTGLPTGAVLRHGGMVNSAVLSHGSVLPVSPGEAAVNAMPLCHTAGSGLATLSGLWLMTTHVLMPEFDPGRYLRLLEEYRSYCLGGGPTMLLALLNHPAFPVTDTSSLRIAFAGGAPVPPEVVKRIEDGLGVPLSILYGRTEASPAITQTLPADAPEDRADTVGRPIAGVEVAILDPRDRTTVLPVGHVGEICTRGFHVMAGYFDDPARTAAAVDEQGWLHTGDLGSLDNRGYLRVQGRLTDMITRDGRWFD